MGKIGKTLRTFSIGQFMLFVSAVVMVVAVVLVLLLSTFIERRAITDLAEEEARQTSELIFQALYSAMRKGWTQDDIKEIVGRLNDTQPDATIRLYRGQPVIDQYGEIEGEKADRDADPMLYAALFRGEVKLIANNDSIRYLYPVEVKEECQTCHDAPMGAINGVVDVTFPVNDLKISLSFVVRSVILYFVVILTIVFVALYFKLRYFIAFPITKFVTLIDEIICNTDLSRRVEGRVSHLSEVQKLSDNFNRLLSTVQDYQDKLRTFSERDPLTTMYNRRKFEEFLELEVERAKRSGRAFSVVMLDIDNFKHINDTYGHPIGDLALKEMASVLMHRLRKTDLICRLGGDEFGVILPDTDIEQAGIATENMRKALADSVLRLPIGNTRLQASFGLVSYPENGADTERLHISMDVALYKAKRQGKNRVCTLEASEEDIHMEVFTKGQALQAALDEDRIVPMFQPICTVATGKPFAYEVLARIRDGDVYVSAGQFIETAEELGLDRPIDERVFHRALKQVADAGLTDIKLFFNLGARTIADMAWMRSIPTLVRSYGLMPQQVVLEITEREALPQFDTLIEVIGRLREEGVVFALDDFGSGFSSFLYLKYLTVDYVKIEGSFVRHIVNDPRDRIMVEHIHSMAKEFGLETIAEFVEDAETVDLLKGMGIDYAQGFHLGRPTLDPGGRT